MRATGRRGPAWLGPALIAGAGTAMVSWTWEKWADPLIDFGRELYVPWQLSQGRVLYADVAYLNGPLSPYLNALWFRLFGVGIRTLVICNLAILAAIVVLLYRLLEPMSDRLAAAAAGLAFVALFAFGHVTAVGNYNFVSPYCHEMTHGLLFALAAFCCLARHERIDSAIPVAGAGAAVGLVFLTKPEPFVAVSLASLVWLGLGLRARGATLGRAGRALGTFLGAALVPPLAAVALLGRSMPAGEALRGTLGSWPWVLGGQASALAFYRDLMGTQHLGASLGAMARCAGGYAAVLVPTAALALALHGTRWSWRIAVGGFPLVAVVLGACSAPGAWLEAPRALPLVTLGLAVAAGGGRLGPRRVPALALAVFALALLAKIFFNVHAYHYGFALAMPATLLVVVALVGWAPAAITARGGCGALFRAVALACLLVAALTHLEVSGRRFAAKTHRVGGGADALLADARGPVVEAALGAVARQVAEGQSLAVLPEGVMLNYLSRRPSPTPYTNFMPPELAFYGEERMLAALRATPPDYVALVHKDTREYGVRFFGRDYGQRVYAWIRRNYREVATFGARPLRDGRFGIALLRRVDAPPGSYAAACSAAKQPVARRVGSSVDRSATDA